MSIVLQLSSLRLLGGHLQNGQVLLSPSAAGALLFSLRNLDLAAASPGTAVRPYTTPSVQPVAPAVGTLASPHPVAEPALTLLSLRALHSSRQPHADTDAGPPPPPPQSAALPSGAAGAAGEKAPPAAGLDLRQLLQSAGLHRPQPSRAQIPGSSAVFSRDERPPGNPPRPGAFFRPSFNAAPGSAPNSVPRSAQLGAPPRPAYGVPPRLQRPRLQMGGGVDRNRERGLVHVRSTSNNTILTLTDEKGNAKAWESAGTIGFKNARKGTSFAGEAAAARLGQKAIKLGFGAVEVRMRGLGQGKVSAVKALAHSGLFVTTIKELTPIPHNGCRPPKRRRV